MSGHLRGLPLWGICLALLAGCSSGSAERGDTPSASPTATTPGGAVASILCRTHRAEIQADEQTLTLDQAAGDTTAVAQLRVKVRDAITAARAIPGCDVDDLVLP